MHAPARRSGRRGPEGTAELDLDRVDACIFDLDGVLTDTAGLHERAWAQVFNDHFASVGVRAPGRDVPAFTHADYERLVDGEAREAGVRNVLVDRGLVPAEQGTGRPDLPVVADLAQRKDRLYVELLEAEGPRPFTSSVDLVRALQARGVAVAVVSGSRHCAQVLRLAGLEDLLDVRVDGETAAAMGLAGKPDPAMFTEAAARIGVRPERAAVVEDALAGVEAGSRGGFAVVVGVDRHDRADALRAAGADVVVADLGRLVVHGDGPAASPWWFGYTEVTPDEVGLTEALCTVGNGYVGTRGAVPWARDDGTSYPGTYVAGVFNRLDSSVAGASIETESLVNVPNWLPVSFRCPGGPWAQEGCRIDFHRVHLDLRRGLLIRRCVVVDPAGRRTAVVERRLASMADPHLLATEVSLIPLGWSGELELRMGIDGGVVDDETVEDRLLANRHLRLVDQGCAPGGLQWLRSRTVQSEVLVAVATRTGVRGWDGPPDARGDGRPGCPEARASGTVAAGARVTVEKVAAVYTSRDRAISEPGLAARQAVADAPSFDQLAAAHRRVWDQLWARAAVVPADGAESARVVTLHLFHLLQVASPHVVDLDAGVGARGLHGEGYRGHVFWDLMFVSPVLSSCFPEVSRSLLAYRGRRLGSARAAATRLGHRGAMFPWQSGSDGRDETPTVLFNPMSGRWIPDHSGLQRHVGLAIAFEAWQHWQLTGDLAFISGLGASLMVEVARFFASLARFDPATDRFRIAGVMGPDEFHHGYPWSEEPGLEDNAYTNVMTAWLLGRAAELVDLLEDAGSTGVLELMDLEEAELTRWKEIAAALHVPFHNGVLLQFHGYERLEPLDLDAYRARYGEIGRLDLLLEAEGDSVLRYQVSKQADVLMLFYLLSAEELREVLERMGYSLDAETIRRTVRYYAERVTHGSSLSRVVHSWVYARADRSASWRYFQEALSADVHDTLRGTTREGIHLGAMAGTVDILRRCYPGLEVRGDALWLNPVLPEELHSLDMRLAFRGHDLALRVEQERFRVEAGAGRAVPATLMVRGNPVALHPGQVVEVELP